MTKVSKILFVFTLIFFLAGNVSADRGYGKKRNKIQLNIITVSTLKKSIPFNLRSGLNYRGSSLLNQQQVGNSLFNNAIITYKKGNTVYILPYRQKVLIPDYSASGYKLIIRPK